MTNDAIDLLPCPWCGDTPSALEWPAGNGKWYSIECVECALEFSSSDLECLSKQWNTRAAPQITPEVRERCIHSLCAYNRTPKDCLKCPEWEDDVYHGKLKRGCRMITEHQVDAVLRELNVSMGEGINGH